MAEALMAEARSLWPQLVYLDCFYGETLYVDVDGTRCADVDASARTIIAADTMIPAWNEMRWVGRSSGFMLSSSHA